ncbi:hypothetical protein, partial [Streptomyces longispororuber]|uniref:hypothetical protein n=1 Tax=Streptomyces longispororuber TaxID=68230 RepID=UPI001E49733C
EWTAWPTCAFLAHKQRYQEAVAVGEESLGLFRKLRQENPDDHALAHRSVHAAVSIAQNLWGNPDLQDRAIDHVWTETGTGPAEAPGTAILTRTSPTVS